jgi:leucine dehydrogenase
MEADMFEDLIQGWDGESVVIHYDAANDTWMFICLHSTRGGAAGGGTRMKVYPTPADGLADAMRLSEAMTLKLAVARGPNGGGKAVLAVPSIPQGEDRRRLLLAYGDLVESLHGTFRTAPDVNTDERDMDIIAERTTHAFGRSVANGGAGTTGPDTAIGVFHGIRAAVGHVFGSDDLHGRRIVVQGAGGVGGVLVGLLTDAGAEVAIADVDTERVGSVAAHTGARLIPPDDALTESCDVLSPCALGGVLNETTIPRLRCRIVAGAANNQLGTAADAERLQQAGILYAPDFVINAGGVLHVVGLEMEGWSRERLEDELAGIGRTLIDIFRVAETEAITTEAAAERLARQRAAEVTPLVPAGAARA